MAAGWERLTKAREQATTTFTKPDEAPARARPSGCTQYRYTSFCEVGCGAAAPAEVRRRASV
jgi:hypothetical protein